MELQTITEDPRVARRAFLDYRKEVRRPLRERASDAERELREIDLELLRAYRQLAKGTTLIRLAETIGAGGFELVENQWGSQSALSKLAIARADARRVWTNGVNVDGDVVFSTRRNPSGISLARDQSVHVAAAFASIRGQEGAWRQRNSGLRSALVPTVPPALRPARSLGGYHVLFEVEEWESPPAPADPALLKHIGGDLWAVLATWNLTPLEAAVLGRR